MEFIFSIPAVILGVMALNKIPKDEPHPKEKKQATAGIIVGAIVLLIISGFFIKEKIRHDMMGRLQSMEIK